VPAIGSLISGISSGSSEHEARIRRKIKKFLMPFNSVNAQVNYFWRTLQQQEIDYIKNYDGLFILYCRHNHIFFDNANSKIIK
jgi:hypothetical protein